jgi:photosystem II stability/assembly factor-like uncharacterized protein
MKQSPVRRRVAAALVLLTLAGALSACGAGRARQTAVVDHVHAAVQGTTTSDIYLGTHYGLVRSSDGGRSWTDDPGLGEEMVGGLLQTGGTYVASLQPMGGPGMKMTAAQSSMPGMSMGSASTPNIGYSQDGVHWDSAIGIPAAATVAALAMGPSSSTVWASLLGRGVYQSTDAGRDWSEVIPSSVPVTDLTVQGENLLLTTSTGLFVTDASEPSMPALPQLNVSVNDVAPFSFCTTCVVAALATGGVALSDDDGVTWHTEPSSHVFDEVTSFSSSPTVLFGMTPAPGDAGHGLWRSADGGHTWQRVLNRSLVDHLYSVPATATRPAYLLAFEWGITVFRSTDGGETWTKISRIAHR